MRTVHIADLHLGFRQYQRCTPAGINQREADVAATFQRALNQILELSPELILVAGDVFHAVRPSNPAILHAYRAFARLRDELPDTPIVMVAGNHDAPRTLETGCILRLFREIGIYVADAKPELFTFPDRDLAVLAVPDAFGEDRPPLLPPGGFKHNVLLMHGEIAGVLPAHAKPVDRAIVEIRPEELHEEQWTYIALGHYHVCRQVASRAWYCGSIDYTSTNPWGELREEVESGMGGKGFIERNLVTGTHRFHRVETSRQLLDLEPVDATGMTAADVDRAIRASIDTVVGGIDDRIVRLIVRNVQRPVVKDLDHAALREYRRRALHFHLDTRKPDASNRRIGEGAPGRRATLAEIVANHLATRVLPAGFERDPFVTLGMQYLGRAEELATAALPALES